MHLIQSLKNEFCFDLPMFSKYPATSINRYFYKMTLLTQKGNEKSSWKSQLVHKGLFIALFWISLALKFQIKAFILFWLYVVEVRLHGLPWKNSTVLTILPWIELEIYMLWIPQSLETIVKFPHFHKTQ